MTDEIISPAATRPVLAAREAATGSGHPAVLAVILVSYLMIVLDISIIIAALPKIESALGFSATGLSWVQNAYTLAFGGLLLLGARAGDLFGRRRMFVTGLGLFTACPASRSWCCPSSWPESISARMETAEHAAGIGAQSSASRAERARVPDEPPATRPGHES